MFASKYLNSNGFKNSKKNRLIKTAINVMTKDSPQNCFISPNLFAPSTFLNPTSLERRSERAVVKFIKLITAEMR